MKQKMATRTRLAIQHLTSSIFDNGRRGNPRPGCDCEQCFGYCLVDSDEAARASFERRPVVARESSELEFD